MCIEVVDNQSLPRRKRVDRQGTSEPSRYGNGTAAARYPAKTQGAREQSVHAWVRVGDSGRVPWHYTLSSLMIFLNLPDRAVGRPSTHVTLHIMSGSIRRNASATADSSAGSGSLTGATQTVM